MRIGILGSGHIGRTLAAGVALNSRFGDINTDDPDLTAFKARGGKLIHVQAINDELVPYQGSVNYYERVLAKMGGLPSVHDFYRFYLVPGMAHGSRNGTANPDANPPVIRGYKAELYTLLTGWVENGVTPGNVVLRSLSDRPVAKSLPMCALATKVTHVGGDKPTVMPAANSAEAAYFRSSRSPGAW